MNIFHILFMLLAAIPRDLKTTYDYIETMSQLQYWRWTDKKVFQLFDDVVKDHEQDIAFRVGYDSWTFNMVRDYSIKVANYFQTAGLQEGDVVSLVGLSGGKAVALWLGLSRVGVISAIIPPHLPSMGIVGAASTVYSKAIVCSPSYVSDLKEESFPEQMQLFSTDETKERDVKVLKKEFIALSADKPFKKVRTRIESKLFYLFDVDTLLPIPVSNYRYMDMAKTLQKTMDLRNKDILYAPIPQSEAAGVIVAAGQAVMFGNTVISEEPFDAKTYFPNCNHHAATVALYNADIIQKLMMLPPSEADSNHHLRLVMGMGLRSPQLWSQFKERFKVNRIGEFYGSIDSDHYKMVNQHNKEGAVGYLPWFAFPKFHIKLISLDENTGDEIRNTNGLCIPAKIDEPGILLEKMPADWENAQFAKRKLVIKDVFRKGDIYINTGNILMRDEQGFFYHVGTVENIKRSKQGV